MTVYNFNFDFDLNIIRVVSLKYLIAHVKLERITIASLASFLFVYAFFII